MKGLADARKQFKIGVVEVLEQARVKNYAGSVYVLKTDCPLHYECSAPALENVTLEKNHRSLGK
jgi:hypothetical protein